MDGTIGAYAIALGRNDWTVAYAFANRLLRDGERVLVVTEQTDDGPAPGTFVVPLSATFDPWFAGSINERSLTAMAAECGAQVTPMSPMTAIIAAPLRNTRIGLYGGGGAPFNHAAILAACGFPIRFISDTEVKAGALAEIDVFVMPGGGERAMMGQLDPLGEEGTRLIAEFIRSGGMYIGCCAGSYDCIINTDEFLQVCPAQKCLQVLNVGPWKGDAVGFLGLQSPGVGVVTVHNESPAHPVMFGMPDSFQVVHYNGPVLDPAPTRLVADASAATPLARFTGQTERFTPAEAFAGPSQTAKPTYLAQAVAAGRYSMAAGEYGVGRVVAFGSHPEFGFDLPMVEWTLPARMLANAVLWQAATTSREVSAPAPERGRVGLPAGAALRDVEAAIAPLLDVIAELAARSIDPPPMWLQPAYAMSVFGVPPDEIWRQTLVDLPRLLSEITSIATRLQESIQRTGGLPLSTLHLIDRWLLDERPASWEQDGGYQGVRSLLRISLQMCNQALAQWNVELGPPQGPYDYFLENPYHQVAGSYLAAIGNVGGALQLMRALESEALMASRLAAPAQAIERVV